MKPPSRPPPIEALSDGAWGRVERELWTRLDRDTTTASVPPPRRGRRWIWLAAPVVAAAVLVVVVTRKPSALTSEDAPARVVAGDATSAVSFGDAHITLDARSALIMQSDRHTVVLDYGAAWFVVGPRNGRPAFEVHAGDASVRVIGTRFRVARDGEQVAVLVDHGVVAVDFRGSHVDLTAGRSWSSTAPDSVVTASAAPSVPPASVQFPATAAPPAPLPDPVTPPPTAIAKPTPLCNADCTRYRALEKLEATQTEAAIKGYVELSRGTGQWAAVALYAAGRLAADRRDPRATALLSSYLRRFPTGENAKDVSVLLARLEGTTP